ncbi:MAG: phosphopyruvate hydratase [Eubacteriales bacterium]|nr:phosphopyruvate hydratase [Eubacteriales bacterium]
MSQGKKITRISAREIFDSRGFPTVEAEVTLSCGVSASAAVPSGASTGIFEAMELRDKNSRRLSGKGVTAAVDNVNTTIAGALTGFDVTKQAEADKTMIELDYTPNKATLGANAILAVSLACAKAAAEYYQMPLYRYIGGCDAKVMPVPMLNILNGGAHASNNVDIQEFMIIPSGAQNYTEGFSRCAEVYHSLKAVLTSKNLSTAVGDEGGFAPDLNDDEDALDMIMSAIEAAGYIPGEDFMIAIDAASSEWYDDKGTYMLPKKGRVFSRGDLLNYWEKLAQKYPIISLEDGFAQDDWEGWKMCTERLGERLQLVGDDLFVTNTDRLKKGIRLGAANSILIKPNQIGTLTETLNAIRMAHHAGYTAVISHRSGETEDTTIADIAVATNAGQIKTGAPARSERVAKYNRLLRIAGELGISQLYPGRAAFGGR